MLNVNYTSAYKRDIKRLTKKHIPRQPLDLVVKLIMEDSENSKETLRQRHNMHPLKGDWSGRFECHVANAGDWLLIWRVANNVVYLERTGTHKELFR